MGVVSVQVGIVADVVPPRPVIPLCTGPRVAIVVPVPGAELMTVVVRQAVTWRGR